MIPAQFGCVRPRTVGEAVDVLAGQDNAKVLAGGQSLLPILRLRLAYPDIVVDLGRMTGVHGIRDEGHDLVIGAMTTHYEVMTSELVRQHCGLLAAATSTVADPQVRHRGTLGGALSHADPAGDLPAVALAFGTTMIVQGPSGRRSVPAEEFFVDYLQTALDPAEVLVEVRIPKCGPADGWGYRYEKFQPVAQAWAIVGVGALVRQDGGRISEARVGLVNMATRPLRATATEQALAGAAPSAVAEAAALAAEGTSPASDLSGQADYRRHLARVLTQSAVMAAAAM
ncbi:MAG TPA: xanthine dehydrogenase family protein subunit M [Streptosporangiaceae bacterium]